MAATNRTLEVILAFRDKLTGGLKASLGGIQNFAKSAVSRFVSIGRSVLSLKGALLGIGGGVTLAGIGAAVKSVADLGDTLLATSQKTGLSVETLSQLKFAAEQSNVSLETLAKSVVKFQVNMAEFARTGKGEAAPAVAELSKEFQLAARKGADVETLLDLLARDFNGLGTETQKIAVAVKLFGRGGAELIPLLKEGKDGIVELKKQSRDLGLVWSTEDAKAADTFGDSITSLKSAISGLLQNGIKPLLPELTKLLDSMTHFVRDNQPEIFGFFERLVFVAQEAAAGIELAVTSMTKSLEAAVLAFASVGSRIGSVWEKLFAASGRPESPVARLTEDVDRLETVIEKRRATRGSNRGNDIPLEELEDMLRVAQRDLEIAKEREETGRRWLPIFEKLSELERQGHDRRVAEGAGSGLEGIRGALAQASQEAEARRQARVRENFLAARDQHLSAFQQPPLSAATAGPQQAEAEAVVQNAQRSKGALDGVRSALDELEISGRDDFANLKAGTLGFANALTDDLSRGTIEASRNWRNTGQVFRDVGRSILETLQAIIVKITVMKGVSSLLGAFGFGKSARIPELLGPDDHPLPIGVAAHGVPYTRGPTLAGEAGEEAVIPLPGNRKVPVHLMGGGGSGGDTYISINTIDAKTFDEYFRGGAGRNRRFLGGIHSAQYRRSRTFRGGYS